jgi:hypothetical protein
VSVGRYAQRGVGKAQELYTLDAERERPKSDAWFPHRRTGVDVKHPLRIAA